MNVLNNIAKYLLLEQDSKLDVLRKSIGERIPISIYYRGPTSEVREGQRIDIEPIVLGKNARTGNLVIWAYVFKGMSKKGLPGWKMFRVDRINSAKFNFNVEKFKLGSLPGYEKGKAPSAMKSLSSVELFSPYWFEDDERFAKKPKPFPTKVPYPERKPLPGKPELTLPQQGPKTSYKNHADQVFNDMQPKIQNVNGQKTISKRDYEEAIKNLYNYKEDEFKIYQRAISGNEKPGEGTRNRFTSTSKAEIDKLMGKNNIKISDNPGQLAEGLRRQSRIKRLINW